MFLAVYETRRVPFNDGAVYVTRTPIDYRVTGEDDEGVYHGEGDTPLAAIADYCRWERERD
jgi:hypothetical protein